MKKEYLNNKMFEEVVVDFQKYKRAKRKNEILLEAISLKNISKRNDKSKIHFEKIREKLSIEQSNVAKEYFESTELLTKCFYLLSQNIIRYAKFRHIDAEDAVQEGVLICFEKIDRFHTSKGKAFNYMTTCILNHFRQLYRSCKNYMELKKRFKTFLIEKHMRSVVYWNGREIIMN